MQIELSIHYAEDIYEEFAAMWLPACLPLKFWKPRLPCCRRLYRNLVTWEPRATGNLQPLDKVCESPTSS